MKRTLFAAVFAGIAFAASAATPVTAPALPSDLATEWSKLQDVSCKKPDGVVIRVAVYEMHKIETGLTRIIEITRNADLVALYELGSKYGITTNVVKVKEPDGTWLNYDRNRPPDDVESAGAVERITGLPSEEFKTCAR